MKDPLKPFSLLRVINYPVRNRRSEVRLSISIAVKQLTVNGPGFSGVTVVRFSANAGDQICEKLRFILFDIFYIII